jgi:hypothetical protein
MLLSFNRNHLDWSHHFFFWFKKIIKNENTQFWTKSSFTYYSASIETINFERISVFVNFCKLWIFSKTRVSNSTHFSITVIFTLPIVDNTIMFYTFFTKVYNKNRYFYLFINTRCNVRDFLSYGTTHN